MKLLSYKRQHGGTLVVVLIMGVTIGTVLGAYLSLVSSRYELTMRSQCWNAAIPVLEAGVEEAMTHLHDDNNNWAVNGWTNGTVGGQTVYGKGRTFSDGSSYYTLIYNPGSGSPYIYSTGLIPAPRHPDTYISRTVKVSGINPPLVNPAFVAIYTLNLNGNTLAADSFNSSLASMSNNGLYDPTKKGTNGNIGSVYGPVDFGNDTVQGNLYLGPTATVSKTFNPSQVSGAIYNDFNFSYPDVSLPASTNNWTQTAPLASGVHDFTTSGDYVLNDNYPIIVETNANVRLYVKSTSYIPTSIHVVGTPGINGVSGSLSIYQGAGSGTINNLTIDAGRARYFWYYGMPGVTSITYGGNTSFTGVIYAPEADLNLNGGGNNIGFIGACVVKTIVMNGNGYVFHFDEDLLTAGPRRGFVATYWQEM